MILKYQVITLNIKSIKKKNPLTKNIRANIHHKKNRITAKHDIKASYDIYVLVLPSEIAYVFKI
jgi:hypothetical protein